MQFRKSLFILSVLALLQPAFAWATYPAEVPRTGQITCYDSSGDIISCTNTGQDGAIQAGAVWPIPRFTEYPDTVIDNLTGLEWTKDANLAGSTKTWQGALDYVEALNTANYLGHSDWRLPNLNELESLANPQFRAPALSQEAPFINVDNCYWSSTTMAIDTGSAWYIPFNIGDAGYKAKTAYFFVWPVRSGQCGLICLPKTGQKVSYATGDDGDLEMGVAWPPPRFIDHNNGTVTDNLTGLMWTKNANLMVTRDPTWDADYTANDGKVTWQHALDYVIKLNTENYLDYSGWRLPNEKEIRSLVDYSRFDMALPSPNPFTNVQSSVYWSSTSMPGNLASFAWLAEMVNGAEGWIASDGKTDDGCVWPVRLGQVGNPLITTSTTSTSISTTTTQPTTTTTQPTTTTTTTQSSTTTTQPTTTTTVSGRPCPAKKVLGENTPVLENLRDFRDSKLAQSAIGRKAIQIYYNNAESINAALERSPALRAVTRTVLEIIAPMVRSKD